MSFMNFLANVNMTFITFLMAEGLLSFIFTQDWKFRWKRVKGYRQLRPYSKSSIILWTFLILVIVGIPLLTASLYLFLPKILENLEWLQLSVLFFISPLVYLWAKLRIIRKKKFSNWDILPILISLLSATLFFIILL